MYLEAKRAATAIKIATTTSQFFIRLVFSVHCIFTFFFGECRSEFSAKIRNFNEKIQENEEKMSVFEKKVVTLHPLKKCICVT